MTHAARNHFVEFNKLKMNDDYFKNFYPQLHHFMYELHIFFKFFVFNIFKLILPSLLYIAVLY